MPDFDPGMKKAAAGLAALHRRGQQAHDHRSATATRRRRADARSTRSKHGGITVTTVAVGSHGPAGSATLQNIATATGGKYYVVNNANALPKIFQREARRIARPLVYEPKPPVSPQITTQHEIVQGLGRLVSADERLRAHDASRRIRWSM